MKKLILNITLLLFSFQAYSLITINNNPITSIKIPKKNIKKYKKQKEFIYQIKQSEENLLIKTWNWIKRKINYILQKILEWSFNNQKIKKIIQYFFTALPYLITIIFSYLIFHLLIGIDLLKSKKNKKQQFNKTYLSNEEQIIQKANLNKLIKNAIQNKQYRLAVRYLYLNTLKKLINKKLIKWHNEKTNHDYINELSKNQIKQHFKKLTFIYDYIWYGNYQPNEKEFEKIKNDFNNFNI